MKFWLACISVLLSVSSTFGLKAVGSPSGFAGAAGVTGGGDRTPITPTTNAELVSALAKSNVVVVLTKIFDFTTAAGTTTETGCAPWSCTPNPQQAINNVNYCSSYPKKVSVTYYNQAIKPLAVGSNISILGRGSNAGLKGVGLKISGSSNVIVQNIRITDLNAKYVWGGDAITIVGSNGVWIDHCFTQNIGRQHLVMGYTASSGVTISNNDFNGATTYSPYCNGKSYWILLLVGINDFITFEKNFVRNSSGRGPHIGGTSGYVQTFHMVNNYYAYVDGHALDPEVGSYTLSEGNYFTSVTTPITTSTAGVAYAPITSAQASACSSKIGRACVANSLSASGSLVRTDSSALARFASYSAVKNYKPMAASAVPNYVSANAGVGKVSI